jgi:hypothetical protein
MLARRQHLSDGMVRRIASLSATLLSDTTLQYGVSSPACACVVRPSTREAIQPLSSRGGAMPTR